MAAAPREVLEKVLLFYTGTHKRGTDQEEEYTAADLDDMVANFRRFSEGPAAPWVPSIGEGHAAEEALWERDDLPKVGEVVKAWTAPVRINGRRELGLFVNLAFLPETYAEIAAGKYDRVSAEIYPQPAEGLVGGAGKMLKRVAILGWEAPQLKHTTNLRTRTQRRPQPAYGEGASLRLVTGHVSVRRIARGRCATFAEVTVMAEGDAASAGTNPVDQDKESLAAIYGLPEEFAATLTDEQVAILRSAALAEQAGTGAADEAPADVPVAAAEGDSATMTREELIAALTDLGEDPAALEAMSDDELRARYDELMGAAAMSEPKGAEKQAAVAPARAFREARRQIDGLVKAGLSRIERAGKALENAVDNRKAAEKAAAHDKKCRTFGDEMVRVGIWTPADIDESNPRVLCKLQQLLRLDDTQVRTFSEGGKEHRTTDLDAAMEEIRRQPARKFGERVPVAGQGGDGFQAIHKLAEQMHAAKKAGGSRTLEEKLGMLPPRGVR